jgi:hypothetical protein
LFVGIDDLLLEVFSFCFLLTFSLFLFNLLFSLSNGLLQVLGLFGEGVVVFVQLLDFGLKLSYSVNFLLGFGVELSLLVAELLVGLLELGQFFEKWIMNRCGVERGRIFDLLFLLLKSF